jgi:agmatinase
MNSAKKRPAEDWFHPFHNFGALPLELSSVDESAIVILPVPYESTTTYRGGCRHGPGSIIEASTNMELYDEELQLEPCGAGIHTSAFLDVVDDPQEMVERVDVVATSYLEQGKFVALLGGEHTITLGTVRALCRVHSDLSVLVLDAHADFRESYRGNEYSHACVGKRVSELCRLVQAGQRSLSIEEARALKEQEIPTFWASEFRKVRGTESQDGLMNLIIEQLTDNTYISIDVDVFDPSIMPAVGTPEPGGLLWEELLNILKFVSAGTNIVGIDLVELAPVDGLVHPQFTAARLLYKALGYAFVR